MSGGPLLSPSLTQLLPRQRLHDIISLEIAVPLRVTVGDSAELFHDARQLQGIMDLLSDNMPNLSRLHLGMKSSVWTTRRVNDAAFYAPFDAFARRHGARLTLFAVSVATSIFFQLSERAAVQVKQGLTSEMPGCMPDEFWRNLDGSFVKVPLGPASERSTFTLYSPYPNPPDGPTAAGGAAVGPGYWVLYGNADEDTRMISCFGSSGLP